MTTKLIQLHFVTPIVPPVKVEGDVFVTTQNIHAVTFTLNADTKALNVSYDNAFVNVDVERVSGGTDTYSYPTANIARIKETTV